jgi:hypothetical protein
MNITINIVELASELASYELEENFGDSMILYKEDDNGDTYYTDKAQDVFNDLYDKYYAVIESYQINPQNPE